MIKEISGPYILQEGGFPPLDNNELKNRQRDRQTHTHRDPWMGHADTFQF